MYRWQPESEPVLIVLDDVQSIDSAMPACAPLRSPDNNQILNH
jgi:hypothetical protein